MALSQELNLLVRVASTEFASLNRKKFLSPADRRQIKLFFLERIINPRLSSAFGGNPDGTRALAGNTSVRRNGHTYMTAKEVEAWLKIDIKTLYRYAQLKLIPHLRIKGNIRFSANTLQRWVARHTIKPRRVKGALDRRRIRPKIHAR